jgi:hypothetical protein
MTTRKQVREELVSIFTTAGAFNAVFGFLNQEFGEAVTKILCVYSKATHHDNFTHDAHHDLYGFYLDVQVRFTNTAADEDALDGLHESIRATVKTNQGNANWAYLDLETDSSPFYAEISGQKYRIEQHILWVTVIP